MKKIGIICTARAFAPEKLQPAIQDLNAWGFEVVIGKSIGVNEHQFAGTDALRADDLQNMLQNPEIDAILCAKGGYGTARIIDLIDWQNIAEKPILGFSDITALHSHVHNLGWQSVHSPMCSVWNTTSETSKKSLKSFLCGEQLHYEFSPHFLDKTGEVKAPIIGGNLSVLYSIMGSVSEMDFTGKILFLEDLDEYLYHTDRMMLCLKRAGKLNNLAGLIVGSFTNMHDNDIPFGKNAYKIIESHIAEFDYPAAFGFNCGHQEENLTLPLGKEVEFIVGKQKSIINF